MTNKEYTYDIGKYTIGVDKNGEDGIGMTVAKVENDEIYFLGNCYGENARCIDLLIQENQKLKEQNKKKFKKEQYDEYLEKVNKLIKENQELKKQLEESKNPLKGIFAQVNDDTLLRDCGAMQSEIDGYKTQQKEFIKFLELMWEETQDIWYIKVLNKYKEIIGASDEKES